MSRFKHALVILSCLLATAVAYGDGGSSTHVGGGGDEVAQDYILMLKKVYRLLKASISSFPEFATRGDLRRIGVILGEEPGTLPYQRLRVFTQERLCQKLTPDGWEVMNCEFYEQAASSPNSAVKVREVSAINYPGQLTILISRSRWKNMPFLEKLATLGYHELMGILGKDDEAYVLSRRFREYIESGAIPMERVNQIRRKFAVPAFFMTGTFVIDDTNVVLGDMHLDIGLYPKVADDPIITSPNPRFPIDIFSSCFALNPPIINLQSESTAKTFSRLCVPKLGSVLTENIWPVMLMEMDTGKYALTTAYALSSYLRQQ